MEKLQLALDLVVGLGQVGRGDHPPLAVEDVAQRPGADLALAEIFAEAGQGHVHRNDAEQLAATIERRRGREADQPERGEDVGVGEGEPMGGGGTVVPEPVAGIVAGRLLAMPELLQVRVEIEVVVEQRLAVLGKDPAIGIPRSVRRRRIVLQLHFRVDAARLAEGAVGQPDIDTDDLGAVQQDRVEILETAGIQVELRILVAQGCRRSHQRLDGREVALDAVDDVDPETLDHLSGARLRDTIIGDVGNGDDREEDRRGQKDERRENAGLQTQIAENHGPAVLERDPSRVPSPLFYPIEPLASMQASAR